MASFVVGISGSSGYQLVMNVYQESQNYAGNYSTVRIQMYIHQTAGSGIWGSGSWGANVDGQGYSGSFSYDYRSADDVWVLNTTKTVYHNADGTRSIGFSGNVNMANSPYATTGSGSGGLGLDTIPRYANITAFTIDQVTDTTARLNWNADVNCDYVSWWSASVDGGAHHDIPVSGTGTFSVTPGGLAPDADHTFYVAVRRADSGQWTTSGAGTARTLSRNKFFLKVGL